MKDLVPGDTITCASHEETIDVMLALAREGIESDFDYEGGLKLVVTKNNNEKKETK